MADTILVYNGADGATGATGPTGPTGPTGATGATGAAGADGNTITATSTAPTGGTDGDLHIITTTYDLYERQSGVWVQIGNVKGTDGADGSDGSDGADGDKWTNGTGTPSDATVRTYNTYYLDTDTGNVYLKVTSASSWTLQGNINGDAWQTTSTDAINLGTLSVGDSQAVTVDSGLSYTAGQFAVVANSSTNYFTGQVTSYSGTTLTLTVTYKTGTGSLSSWDVNLAGVTQSDSTPQWYTITATAGTGTVTSRTYTAPSGWTVDASDIIAVSGFNNSNKDLTIQHNTGLYAVDVVVMVDDGTKYTKAKIPTSYSSLYTDTSHTSVELTDFCTESKALIIHIKLY